MFTDPTPPAALRLDDIAAVRHSGTGPTFVWLSGYASDMNGNKATWLSRQCAIWSYNLLKFDYRGTGQSGGTFADMTLTDWLDDTLKVIDQLTDGPLILVGSSMGGWLGLKAATLRPDRVRALALIAPAPDFTKRHWDSLTAAEQTAYAARGTLPDDTHHVPLSYKLVADGNANHLLLNAPISFDGPVEIIHGLCDDIVPPATAQQISDLLTTEDVTIHYVKDARHDLSRPQDLDILWQMLTRLREKVAA